MTTRGQSARGKTSLPQKAAPTEKLHPNQNSVRRAFSPRRSILLRRSSTSWAAQDALVVQSSTDFCDVIFSKAQGFGIGMNGVVARHEIVRVLDGRAEDEARIRERFKLDRLVAPLENDDFAGRYTLRGRHHSLVRGDPGDVVVLGRLINPALAGLEAHIEIRHALRRLDDAFDAIIFASDDPCWAGIMEIGSVEILAFGFGEFEGGWHRHPQLKTLDPLIAVHSAGVPDAATGAHPLDTAGLDNAFAVGGLLVERL